MPKPTPIPLRRAVYDLRQKGWSAAQIAEHLRIPVRTVRHLSTRFAQRGEAGLEPSYRSGPRALPPEREPVRQAAEQLRREHPGWGAGLIAVYLSRRFPTSAPAASAPAASAPAASAPAASAPAARTVQRWLARAGLGPAPRGRRPSAAAARATSPHGTWQLDAAEGMQLQGGAQVSWLRIADECTGAVLATRVFPLRTLGTGRAAGRAGVPAAVVRPLGSAGGSAGG